MFLGNLGYHVRLLFPPQPSGSCTNVSFNYPQVFDHPRTGAVAQKCAWITCPHKFYSFPFMLLPNKITYYSFLYFKTSKQGYLISFNSFPFHFFPYLNTFNSFMIILLHSIPFPSELMMKLTYWLMNFESTPYFAIFPFWPMGELILRPLLPSKPRLSCPPSHALSNFLIVFHMGLENIDVRKDEVIGPLIFLLAIAKMDLTMIFFENQ